MSFIGVLEVIIVLLTLRILYGFYGPNAGHQDFGTAIALAFEYLLDYFLILLLIISLIIRFILNRV